MALTSDRADMLARLRSATEPDAVLAAAQALKAFASAIVLQNTRSQVVVGDCLDAIVTCLPRFPGHVDITEALTQAASTMTGSRKEFAMAGYGSGVLSSVMFAMKCHPRHPTINVNCVRVLIDVCSVDKRAAVMVRLQGGLVSVVELLGQTSFDSDQKLTRLSLDFLALMVKRSPASTAVIAKVRGIDLVVQASRRHLANARVFSSALALLERLCASRLAIGKVLDNGFVQFIYDALAQYKFVYKTFVVLMRMLRNVASVEDGARVIQDSGGFDAILALIDHHLMKPAAVRLACLVLWHLQRHHGAAAPDSIYNLKSNFLPLKFPNDDAPDVDDGYASDDSCSDVDDDDRAGEAAGADPAPGSSPIDADFDPVHFSPELWDPRDPASIAFFNRAAVELRAADAPKSVRRMLACPDCLVMAKANGRPGIDTTAIEQQHVAPPSMVLTTMNASTNRFRVANASPMRVVYDRSFHDGAFLQVPASSSSPKTTYNANDTNAIPDDGPGAPAADATDQDDAPSFLVQQTDPSPYETPSLTFESRFESGNLFRAIRTGETEYDLILSSDINAVGRTQWFLFRVQDTRANAPYKFNIVNLEKPDSAFNRGMRPVMFSQQAFDLQGRSWARVQTATDIAYFQNYLQKPHAHLLKRKAKKWTATEDDALEHEYHFTLTFTMTFPYDNDTVFLAHCYPFTFSFQRACLASLESSTAHSAFLRRQVLCYSRGGNAVDLLTITNFKSSQASIEQRPVVVLTARIHPGETNASWVMKGALEFLTGSSDTAILLRDSVVFKLIPMLNPDGVIEGNYRCSLSGHDQNRQWMNPRESTSPVVYHAKRMIQGLARTRTLLLFCDFHGHSITSNFMMYGNDEDDCAPSTRPMEERAGPAATRPSWLATVGADFPNKERIFPTMVARRAYSLFSMEQCCFSVQKSRAGTARVVLWRELPLTFCFTLEATFSGSSFGPLKGLLYNPTHYETMGQEFCRTIHDLVSSDQAFVSRAALEVTAFHNGADAAKQQRRRLARRKQTADKPKTRPPAKPRTGAARKPFTTASDT
ncbi:tubulin-glutamate carboxypeptidase [Plasmodiophora brassicae]